MVTETKLHIVFSSRSMAVKVQSNSFIKFQGLIPCASSEETAHASRQLVVVSTNI
jgi:hypothetical protein